ncbi:hypothetical protein JTB14_012869 [Gonioctena quinquepunctata]|nr:hypothetical protein JTB14_012869 [Gonioctena quinquepunctata]
MTILQTNLGRNRAAHDAAFATATDIDADIIVVSEPNKKICNGRGCVYLSPNITREDYRDKLENIMQKARRCQSEKIIAGDFNAKSAEWGSPTTDARGTILMDWTSTPNLIVQNRGSKPTFVRRATGSFIDVTLASQKIAKSITNWRVLDDETLQKNDTKTSNVYWWNADIANKRKECTRHRREITRKRGNRHTNAREIEEAEDLYKTAKKELRKLINESKKKCWQELLKDLENDI